MNQLDSLPPRILITDDETDLRQCLSTLVRGAGYDSIEAADGQAALQILRDTPPDAVLLDINMPGMNGMRVLREAIKLGPAPPIVMLTGFGTIHSAVEAMREGAFDYLTKPFNNEALLEILRRAVEHHAHICGPGPVSSLAKAMGPSDKIRKLSELVNLVAPTDFTVVISGETGSGKELVAKEIHRCSRRSTGPFMPVDCGSIPSTLIESELFGHMKGSFTGADRTRAGKFEEASGGTLFLDEVQNLSLGVQAKLLRALQERQISRVGDSHPINLNVRIVAATNEDLLGLIDVGRFRRDLHHRLNEFAITVPPLSARPSDLLYLADRFLHQTCQELNKPVCSISEAAQKALLEHHWPGNVRELRNVIRRAVLSAGTTIHPEHLLIDCKNKASGLPLPMIEEKAFEPISLKEVVREATIQQEREILVRALHHTHGNHARAARLLQIDYKTLRLKTKQYDIHLDK